MSEPILQAMYSVPIRRRVGSTESIIPEEYRHRIHTKWQEHVRCSLYPGENLVKITWDGPEQAILTYQRENGAVSRRVGVVPASSGGGGTLPELHRPSHIRRGLYLRVIRRCGTGRILSNRISHGHRDGRILTTPVGVA
ncbi:hypothetical protein HMPREF1219_00171 [Corynebacterium pyruviciproducens ATCC BAA-1742]|uniref:Uncharacterized protein n=1 Tax=Corynebacterium pyruviciproducens ATCC BAA-1742 TaxID=1125779 RepID=S2Z387_9CORY|nr:hypothetical protein HMPREF1219_00171 [Corynebacterium pyruviciproducens ATCC BAA-1742]